MKRIINLFLAVSVLISILSFVPASAETKDWIIGEFSNGTDNNISEWIGEQGTSAHSSNIQNVVTRYGKKSALEWNHAYGNKALTFKGKENAGKMFGYDYLYIWIYSKKANNQQVNTIISDHTKDSYVNEKFFIDFTGWKLIKIDISKYNMTKFGSKNTAVDPTDLITINLRNTGWEGSYLTDTHLFIDSVFFSNNDYLPVIEEKISTDFPNGAYDVEATDFITINASPAFKAEIGYYDDKVTVLKDGIALTDGYLVNVEYNKAYIQFDEVLESGAEYTIQFNGNAVMADGTAIGDKGTISFTVAEKELELSGITFNVTELPASGKVVASVNADNISDDSITAVLILGVYDKTTNRMIDMDTSESITIEPGKDDDFTAEVTLASYENCYVRAFLWDSENGMYSYGEYGEI